MASADIALPEEPSHHTTTNTACDELVLDDDVSDNPPLYRTLDEQNGMPAHKSRH